MARALIAGLAVLAFSFSHQTPLKAQKTPQPETKPGASAPAASSQKSAQSDYVGSETCKACHEDLYNGWEKSPHWKTTLNTKGGPSRQGCEACHGPGSAHIAGGGDPTKIFVFKEHSANEITSRCLSCHAGGAEHMNALNSIHSKNGVSCISCHSPHHAQSKEFLLAKAQPELCYSCHLQQKPQFEMPFHHRINEGLMLCSDCHNVHGAERAKQVRMASTQDAICFKCHTDKQGPFVFEHEAVKMEGCQACHTPHGSPNPHMLKLSNVNMLCLQCHTASNIGLGGGTPGTPNFHNQNTFFQACTLCHVQIHGSNFDPRFFK